MKRKPTPTTPTAKAPVPDAQPVGDAWKNLSEKDVWQKVYNFSNQAVKFIASMFTDTLLNSKALGVWKPRMRTQLTTAHVRRIFNVSMDNGELTRKFRELDPSWKPPQGFKNARHVAFALIMALLANGAGEEMLNRSTNAKIMNPEKWVEYLVDGPAEIIR